MSRDMTQEVDDLRDQIIRDYLTSPAAEKALAEALRKVEGLGIADTLIARRLLAAWVASLEKASEDNPFTAVMRVPAQAAVDDLLSLVSEGSDER